MKNDVIQYDTAQQAVAVKKNNELTAVMANSTSWKQFAARLPQAVQERIPNDVFSYVNLHADTVGSLDANEFMARVVECYSKGYTLTEGDGDILPFWNGKEKRNVATFIPGYKGIIRRAMETGLFKYFTVSHIYEGAIKGYDYRRGVPIFNEQFIPKGTEKVIGYLGYYQMINGAEQEIYCSADELIQHAIKFSPQSRKAGELAGVWQSSTDAMCVKTMYRKLGKLAPKIKNPTRQQAQFYASLEESDEPQEDRPPYIDVDGVVVEANQEPLPFDEYEPELPQEQDSDALVCADCGAEISEKVCTYSSDKFGRPLCYNCQKKQK